MREAEARRLEHDAWATRALCALWEALGRSIAERAREFTQATGAAPEVRDASETEWGRGGPRLHVLRLTLGDAVVYLYSHRVSGAEPNVHLALWPGLGRSRRFGRRVVSLPVGRLTRMPGDGWELRAFRGDRAQVTVDDIAYRAFELLVEGLRHLTPKAVRRLEPGPAVDARSGATLSYRSPS